jgi:hypothetical protein
MPLNLFPQMHVNAKSSATEISKAEKNIVIPNAEVIAATNKLNDKALLALQAGSNSQSRDAASEMSQVANNSFLQQPARTGLHNLSYAVLTTALSGDNIMVPIQKLAQKMTGTRGKFNYAEIFNKLPVANRADIKDSMKFINALAPKLNSLVQAIDPDYFFDVNEFTINSKHPDKKINTGMIVDSQGEMLSKDKNLLVLKMDQNLFHDEPEKELTAKKLTTATSSNRIEDLTDAQKQVDQSILKEFDKLTNKINTIKNSSSQEANLAENGALKPEDLLLKTLGERITYIDKNGNLTVSAGHSPAEKIKNVGAVIATLKGSLEELEELQNLGVINSETIDPLTKLISQVKRISAMGTTAEQLHELNSSNDEIVYGTSADGEEYACHNCHADELVTNITKNLNKLNN